MLFLSRMKCWVLNLSCPCHVQTTKTYFVMIFLLLMKKFINENQHHYIICYQCSFLFLSEYLHVVELIQIFVAINEFILEKYIVLLSLVQRYTVFPRDLLSFYFLQSLKHNSNFICSSNMKSLVWHNPRQLNIFRAYLFLHNLLQCTQSKLFCLFQSHVFIITF